MTIVLVVGTLLALKEMFIGMKAKFMNRVKQARDWDRKTERHCPAKVQEEAVLDPSKILTLQLKPCKLEKREDASTYKEAWKSLSLQTKIGIALKNRI